MTSVSRRTISIAALTAVALLATSLVSMSAGAQPPAPSTGQRYGRLLIRNANIIDGTGNPTRGPFDILVQGSTIVAIQASQPAEFSGSSVPGQGQMSAQADRVIDAKGMTVMPGIIDMHAHIQFSRASKAMPKDYVYKLWLAHGITTIREPGSGEGIDTTVAHAKLSAENRIAAPTIIPYATAAANSADEARTL